MINIGDGFLYGATSRGTGTAGQPIGTVFKLDPSNEVTPITAILPLPGSGSTPMIPLSLVSGEENVLHVLGSSPGGIWRVPLAGECPPRYSHSRRTTRDFPVEDHEGERSESLWRHHGHRIRRHQSRRPRTIFRIAPNGSGFQVLHDCLSETGVAPKSQLVEDTDGILYGAMSSGGTNLDGVIFKITKEGDYTPLHHVNDNPPTGDLLLASDGKLYGTSSNGGQNLYGSIFRINRTARAFRSFTISTTPTAPIPMAV
jgi:hypothetical protein